MIKIVVVLSLFFMAFNVSAQKKFIQSVDTNSVSINPYLVKYNHASFFSSDIGDEEIDMANVNTQLLEASIFFHLNQWRHKNHRELYKQNKVLNAIASSYVLQYRKNRFEPNLVNYGKLEATLKKAPKYMDIDFTYIRGSVLDPYVINYKRGDYFYDENIHTSESNLYYGNQKKVDSTHVAIPILPKTYNQLAYEVLISLKSGRNSKLLRSKAYELIGVAVMPSSMNFKKPVKVKITIIVGGFRTKYLLED